ncbi:hypothetical protein M569_00905 [Genlisea aurea]|uniref:DYW domain-containing protein n=1 Tax=Genlisea aurea TaxID=192259 RepID=S8EMF1_9LAMI|nr:hypothetical protein M569_00905 [Genlisea aurea]
MPTTCSIKFPRPTTSHYNSLLFGYSRGGLNEAALKTYADVNRSGIAADQFTISCVLKASADSGNLPFGRQAHCQSIKNGFLSSDVSVGSSLVNMYIKTGCLESGNRVFEEMREHNVVTWTSLLTGFAKNRMIQKVAELLGEMRLRNVEPNFFTYSAVLGALADESAVESGAQLHGMAVKHGLNSILGNSLVSLYAKCGMIREAEDAFDDTQLKDAVSWNGMMEGFITNGFELEALEVFSRMRLAASCVRLTESTFATVLKLCGNLKEVGFVRQIHSQVVKYGYDCYDNITTNLMVCYMKTSEMNEAAKFFSSVINGGVPSVISWTAIIKGYQQNGREEEAIDMFLEMKRWKVKPNHFTYSTIISLLPERSLFQVHAEVVKVSYESSPSVGTALLDAYTKLGRINDAAKAFERIEEKDIVAWSAMVVAYAQQDNTEGAVKVYQKLVNEGINPNEYTFSSIINACAIQSAATEQGKQFHANSIKFGYNNALMVSSALVTMYSKKGDIESANTVFSRQQERDTVSWNSMISGYAQHGYGEKALKIFREMQNRNIQMDEITFIGVISACTHAGMIQEGEMYFDMMVKKLHLSPTMEIYSCMVDLYGRAGMLTKATALIDQMPFPAGPTVWRTLLAACRVHGHLELGKIAAEKLISFQPQDSSAYVLLANLCAAAGNWMGRAQVRKMMDEKEIKKETGFSWIEVKNKTYSFMAGDVSHPLSDQIYAKLAQVSIRLKEKGYRPDTTYVLHDIEEEQKEAMLSRHSERLAIAFGLISIPPGIIVRVIKNLRVCGDCHTVIKLITEIEGRDIVVRDSNRFHHFSKGSCSCGDYW